EDLGLADRPVVDPPLGVVARRSDIVVAGVYIADLVGRPECRHGRRHITLSAVPVNAYVQQDQPPGVPPLELTGERTLPDVPAENYWFRRHLAVYEWIAARVGGKRVVDMACGEGYGSAVLARRAHSVTGLDANPEAHE